MDLWPLYQRARLRLLDVRLAWGIVTRRLDYASAVSLLYLAEEESGIFALESISVECLLEDLAGVYVEAPEFRSIARRAVTEVAAKWQGGGHLQAVAVPWAKRLFIKMAEREGVLLYPIDDIPIEEAIGEL